jgi:hypothetical protein
VLSILAAVLIALVLGVWIFGLFYEPLTGLGNLWGVTGAHLEQSRSRAQVVDYEDGKSFTYFFTLSNDGPFGVTITGVDLNPPSGPGYVFMIESYAVAMGSETNEMASRPIVPFEPFGLKPGEFREIHIRARFDDCEVHQEGIEHGFSGESVTYRFLWIERTVDIATPGLKVPRPSLEECPRGRDSG